MYISGNSGLLSFNKPEKVLWTIANIIIGVGSLLKIELNKLIVQ